MNELEEARKKINEIDQEMAALFEERMRAAKIIVNYKMHHGLPILDAAREQEVIERNLNLIHDREIIPFYQDFLVSLMDISKSYQKMKKEQE